MLRRFLIILVCWPLLMPPGFCLCRLEAFSPRPAERPSVAADQDQAETPTPRCRCCRPAYDVPLGKPASDRDVSSSIPPSPNEPHAPGCPASPQWEAARVSLHADGSDLADSLFDYPVASWFCDAQVGPLSASFAPSVGLLPASALSLFSCNFRC